MPTDENLPVQHANATQNDRAERMPSGEDLLKPGSWWSLCDDAEMVGFPAADIDAAQENANTLRGKQMFGPVPDHGIVLMVKEVRLDDGAPHTIIMHPHPLWGRDGDFRMLVGPFLAAMRHEPDGAAKRALEEAQMMGRIEQITSDMAKPASEEEVMKIVDAKKEAEAKKAEQERARAARSGKPDPNAISHDRMALVPAALLPSRDVADAERVVKDQIMITEARAEIMKSSMNRIQNGMAIISKFQEEKVAVALAGISQQTDFAKSMMSRVHTMKLWLGEGVGVSPLAEGDGAPVDEKIRFMQQLLYLDEEIFTEKFAGEGFSGDHMGDLGQLLSENPDMVRRILPYERCVAITRVRRQARQFPVPGDWAEVFATIERSEQDRLIQILVRDGDKITMISADEETSNAQRLFPSSFEIDSIFTKRGFGETTSVDVNHIEYTDKKREHDDRALFYKRFLLILWGAHERHDIFGDVPKGLNWLTRDVHDRFFDFIRDEEMGLPDGRAPVRRWIEENNRDIRPGSMVVATWKALINSTSAPGAWSNHVHYAPEQNKESARNFDLVSVQRRGDELFVTAECKKLYSYDSPSYNVKVSISEAGSPPGTVSSQGLICIDHMKSADLRAYVESRKHRVNYLEWLGQAQLALPQIEARETLEKTLVARLEDKVPSGKAEILGHLPDVAHEAVLAAGWSLPKESADKRLLAMARMLARDITDMPEDALQVSLRAGGELVALYPAAPLLEGAVAEPFAEARTYVPRQGGPMKLKSAQIVPLTDTPAAGEIVIGDRMSKDDIKAAWHNASKGVSTIADRDFILSLRSEEGVANLHEILDYLQNPGRDEVVATLEEIIHAHRTKTKIQPMNIWTPIGAFTLSNGDENGTAGLIGFDHHPVYHAWLSGYKDEVNNFLDRLYNNPEGQRKRFSDFEAKGRNALRLWSTKKERRDAQFDRFDNLVDEFMPNILSSKDIAWMTHSGEEHRIASLGTSIRDMLRREVVADRVTGFFGGHSEQKEAEAMAFAEGVRIHVADGIEDRVMEVIARFEKPGDMPVFDI